MRGYVPSNKKSKNIELRQSLYSSLAGQESRYKHYIPPTAIKRTASKFGLHTKYEHDLNVHTKGFKDNGRKEVYSLRDRRGVSHGEVAINANSKKVDWWRIK